MSQNGCEFLSKTPLNCRSKNDLMDTASICSCSICDSISCFELRKKDELSCSCSTCRPTIPCSAKCCLNISTDTIKDKPNSKTEKKQTEKQCVHESINNQKQSVHKSINAKKQIVCESSNDKKQNECEPIKNKKSETNKQSHTKIKSKDKTHEKKIAKYYKKSLTQIESIVLTYTTNNKDTCTDTNEKRPCNANESKIPDILTRLKEIYKVCSCKICECIPKISITTKDICTCKPCDCAECTNPNLNTDSSCDKCVKKDCRGIAKKTKESCNCKPCECLECMDRLNKLCKCEPCQCTECAKNTLGKKTSIIIAHVQEKFSPNTCQCEPCGCVDCAHSNSTIARRDISSDISYRRSQYDTCLNDIWQLDRCDGNKIIGKTVQSDSRNYDIHSLSDQNVRKYYNNFDTIAMIALSDNHSNSVFHYKENCKCLQCECHMCNKSDKNCTDNKFSKYVSQDLGVTTRLNDSCKCVPCECEMCTRTQNEIEPRNASNTKKSTYNGCACKSCDCVKCKGIRDHKTYSNSTKEKTAHFVFEPATKDISYVNTFPLKKGKLLTPSTFEAEMVSPSKLKVGSCLYNKEVKKPIEKGVSLKVNSKELFHTELSNQQNFSVCCTGSKHIFLESKNSQQMFYRNPFNTSLGNDNFTNQVFDHNKTDMVSSNSNIHLGESRANSYIFNNNLHCSLNMRKTLENYMVADRNSDTNFAVDDFDNNTIVLNSNVVDNIDEPKFHMIKSDKQINLQEKDDITHKKSILAIYKSPSKSTICDNILERNSKEADIIDSKIRNSIYVRTPEGDRCAEDVYDKSSNIIADNNFFESIAVVKTRENNEINEPIHRDILYRKHNNKLFTKRIPMYSKMYRRLLKRIQVSKKKKTRILRRLIISNLNNENNKATERLENHLENKTENRLDLRKIDIRNSINTYFSPELNTLNKIKTEVENIDKNVFNMPWSLLRKNISLNCTAVKRSMGVCTIPDLEMGIKCSVKSASTNSTLPIQNKYIDSTTQTIALNIRIDKETNYCNVWKSMEYLQSSMKYLLHMILARAVNESDVVTPKLIPVEGLADDLPKIDSVKSSCDGLKAMFTGVRKVSNHTLLVRWKVPPKIADVQGYELQVDGRSMKKIFSPTRCMAILTCLPHCDKILLTIRTLTASDIPSDHCPASTIVYRPKVK